MMIFTGVIIAQQEIRLTSKCCHSIERRKRIKRFEKKVGKIAGNRYDWVNKMKSSESVFAGIITIKKGHKLSESFFVVQNG